MKSTCFNQKKLVSLNVEITNVKNSVLQNVANNAPTKMTNTISTNVTRTASINSIDKRDMK